MTIDGCLIPDALYNTVKLDAMTANRTRFVGVHYAPPARPLGWGHATHNYILMREDLQAGKHCSFTIHSYRDEVPDTCLMVLWITPRN